MPIVNRSTALLVDRSTAPLVNRSTAPLDLAASVSPPLDLASAPISPSPPPRDLNLIGFDFLFLLGFVSFVNECGIDSLLTCLH